MVNECYVAVVVNTYAPFNNPSFLKSTGGENGQYFPAMKAHLELDHDYRASFLKQTMAPTLFEVEDVCRIGAEGTEGTPMYHA